MFNMILLLIKHRVTLSSCTSSLSGSMGLHFRVRAHLPCQSRFLSLSHTHTTGTLKSLTRFTENMVIFRHNSPVEAFESTNVASVQLIQKHFSSSSHQCNDEI